MSTTTTEKPEEMEFGTKPQKEHEWLQKLVGNWTTEAEMFIGPDKPTAKVTGTQKVKSLGGLWAVFEGSAKMPNGKPMEYQGAIGYDVSFKEYRGCRIANMSSHLWKWTGTLSVDEKTMTLDCVGPNMIIDGETANYRDVIEIIDDNHRIMTSYGQDEKGEWIQFMQQKYTRV